MSDHFLRFIPKDPAFVLDQADEVSVEATESVQFVDAAIGDMPALQITVRNREDADKFLRRFNGRNSFDGRVW